MSLLKKVLIGACDMLVEATGAQMSNIERHAKDNGKELNNDFYDRKERYNESRSRYEYNKSRMED